MKSNKYEIQLYHTSFCTYKIEAENAHDAIMRARKLPPNNNEILPNMESWEDADTAIKLSQIISFIEKGEAI